MASVINNFLLKKITSTRVGGPARYFINIRNEDELARAIKWAETKKLGWVVVGDGTNLIPNDQGFGGLIIRNQINKFEIFGNQVALGAGDNLLKSIQRLNKLGLGGLEKMAGIPGTVGGAIYGCAGAYGQEIKDCLVKVHVWKSNFQTWGGGWLTKQQCQFAYRDSIFKKHKNWIITEVIIRLKKSDPHFLQRISAEIIKTREKKYWPTLLCPGSFFKNIVVSSLKPAVRKSLLARIDISRINHGKLPAGYLLERVGAMGMQIGGIAVASHHANLIFNKDGGQSSDIKKLSLILKKRVQHKFGITLEEEVQYL